MRPSSSRTLASLLFLLTAVPLFAMPHPHRGPTSPKARGFARTRTTSPRATHVSAPAGIAPERATQIQSALIKSGYMSGEPSGVWDSSTQAAMVKLQAANGWQTKLVPDSRAIIKLGLGPGSAPPTEPTTFEASTPAASQSIPAVNQ